MRAAARKQLPRSFLAGTGTAALFAATALEGDVAGARHLFHDASAWLPGDVSFNPVGRWSALMSIVNGLALLDDRDGLARCDLLASRLASNGMPVDMMSLGPNNADLCAALTAAAVGDATRAERHYDNALRISHQLPNVLLEPNVLYWRGRFECDRRRPDAARPLLQSACDQFPALGMVLHRDRAARALDES
jgi:hypothetical protein